MAVSHPRLTRDEFDALLAESDWRAPLEHIGGEAVVTPPIGGCHAGSHNELVKALHGWQAAHDDRGLVLSDVFVLFGEDTMAPDIAYWTARRRPEVGRGRIDGPVPDLVVEIASPSTVTNDRGPKRERYAAAGVREQWLVDPEDGSVEVVDAAGRVTVLGRHGRLSSTVLTGFAIECAALFLSRGT